MSVWRICTVNPYGLLGCALATCSISAVACRPKKSIRCSACERVLNHQLSYKFEPLLSLRFISCPFSFVLDSIWAHVLISHTSTLPSIWTKWKFHVIELIERPYAGPWIEFMWLNDGRAYGELMSNTVIPWAGGGGDKQIYIRIANASTHTWNQTCVVARHVSTDCVGWRDTLSTPSSIEKPIKMSRGMKTGLTKWKIYIQ